MKEIKFIMFYLNQMDIVIYRTDVMNSHDSMRYKDFIKWISKFGVIDYFKMKDAINNFHTILYWKNSKKWEIIKPQADEKDLTFENLSKLNKDKLVVKENKVIKEKQISKAEALNRRMKNRLNKGYERFKGNYKSY